jgi:hypothetical protein
MNLGPIQPPIQWVLGVKQLEFEADPSPLPSAEVKECLELYLHSPNTPSRYGALLKKAQGQLFLRYPIEYCIDKLSYFMFIHVLYINKPE